MVDKVFLTGTKLLLSFIFMCSIANEANSQNSYDNVNISYGIDSWNPVHIKIEEKTERTHSQPIKFTAINSTYYTFKLSVNFRVFENLAPKPAPRPVNVRHGNNSLFTFSIHVPGNGYSYDYSYSYWLSPSDEDLNENYPYLVPIREGETIIPKSGTIGNISNSFTGNKGDTIFAMRRGLVTAVPQAENVYFRISDYECMEIMHDDGTFMIYYHISREPELTSKGKIVLPGQPIGLISDNSYVMGILLKVSTTKNLLQYLPINYAMGEGKTVSCDEFDGTIQSVHPKEVISMELTRREKKKIQKK